MEDNHGPLLPNPLPPSLLRYLASQLPTSGLPAVSLLLVGASEVPNLATGYLCMHWCALRPGSPVPPAAFSPL